jgi:hypothetical protein
MADEPEDPGTAPAGPRPADPADAADGPAGPPAASPAASPAVSSAASAVVPPPVVPPPVVPPSAGSPVVVPPSVGSPIAGSPPVTPPVVPPRGARRRRRLLRRWGVAAVALIGCVALLLGAAMVALTVHGSGTLSPAAHGTGNDAEWLGHAWVDGRETQADVDALAAQLRGTGIHDLFVHAGPFNDDGTLDPGLRPRARWLTGALHAALPGVRVQAWLGAHPVPGHLHLDSATTRAAMLTAVGQVLDDGFDGVHYDLEPVADGDPDLLTLLSDTHALTQRRHAVLSVSAIHNEPLPGMAAVAARLPGHPALWSAGYLHDVALRVDQMAVMAYDTGLWTQGTFAGYVRRSTAIALAAVPPGVTLFIGVPAYHDEHLTHHRGAETVSAALRGVRLALGAHPRQRAFGVAMYVDFAATTSDWSSYHDDWANLDGAG